MKSLGPAWWGGMLFGLFLGMFTVALVVESEAIPSSSPAWRFVRGGSATAACLAALIGNWGLRR